METIEMLINEIESMVLQAKKMPLSNGDVIVNRNNMLSLISRFRESYPSALKEAITIQRDRDLIIDNATKYANETAEAAEVNARIRMSDSEIMKKAKEQANAILSEAEDNYNKTDYQARIVAFNILKSVEDTLSESINAVNRKKADLINKQ